MSRCLPGIQGVPFRAIEMRRKAPGSKVWVETLSCGHEHILVQHGRYDPPFGTKRRCYSCKVIADRRSKHIRRATGSYRRPLAPNITTGPFAETRMRPRRRG